MKKEIKVAANLLQQGYVVAIPTETVYGLAANAFDEKALAQIFEIKKRPLFNPLIVHIKSIDYLHTIAKNIPAIALDLANHFWPGALTLVLEKKSIIPDIVTGGKNTVGIRIPSHTIALSLLEKLDFPLAAPSANPFGYISPTTSEHVKKQLGDKIPYILEGGSCEKGIESTIIGFENNKPILYRVGAISKEEIEKIIGKIETKNTASASPEAPGMLSKHYSPKTKFFVSENISDNIENNINKNIGFLLFKKTSQPLSYNKYIQLSLNEDINEAAQNLYAAMHRLDAMNFEAIYAEKVPEKGIGISINDRLYRAQEENFDFTIE
ncbi:L-threonylcarbamoyladenylate synthase [Flavobacterium luteum]|uniref:Threonylcarbamoyl-AMP synthase n=1 Tax=Flavobacterium luteum TaxID=2026654 RepID=A0A7J5AJ64_9FLAO|nr:L-threonylcarbamoyladenylate synthase [Flavobacterium luteum]KAB1157657.1 threonylcarbamoyl-AMP synthase [Flavobacterium luteum]